MNSESLITSFILENLPPTSDKSIVDVGANLNADFSKGFIENGWKALLIEPQPKLCDNLRSIYSNNDCIIVNKACGDSKKDTVLYLAKGGDSQLATLNNADNSWFRMVRDNKTINVECDTLSNIIKEYNFNPNFSVLKIDTESWDYYVLKGLDFNKYRPVYIVSEDFFLEAETTRDKYYFLEDNGYVLLGWVEHNSLWRKKDKNINFINLLIRDFLQNNKIYPSEFGLFDIRSKIIPS